MREARDHYSRALAGRFGGDDVGVARLLLLPTALGGALVAGVVGLGLDVAAGTGLLLALASPMTRLGRPATTSEHALGTGVDARRG